ncbi:MAG: hypothetical protein AABO41_18605 [Acidobacteriota bacterium]
MIKRLFILTFIVAVVANSAAAVASQMNGGTCSMSCCKAAHDPSRDVAPARLRCMVDCNQPASTIPSPTTALLSASQKKTATSGCFSSSSETVSYIRHIRFPNSPTRSITGCSSRYLETGTLLI